MTSFEHLHQLIESCAEINPLEIHRHPELDQLLAAMLEKVQGADDFVYAHTVLSGANEKLKSMAEHKHKEHLVVYYVKPQLTIIGRIPVYPEVGEFLYVEPYVMHMVPQSEQRRLSVAMLVEVT